MKASISSGEYEVAPTGLTPMRPFMIIDIGIQDKGEYGMKRQIIMGFELVNRPMKDGRPFTLIEFFSLNLSSNANLCKFLEAIYGKTMPDDAKDDFDFAAFLGTPCMGNIIHKPKKMGGTGAYIGSYAQVEEGREVPELQNEKIFFDLDNIDLVEYDKIKPGLAKLINDGGAVNALRIGATPMVDDLDPF